MAANPNKAIQDITDAIEVHVQSFIKGLPKAQTALFDEIVNLSKEFILPAKTVKDQAFNLKLIGKIDSKIKEVLITPEYQNNVDDYLDAFDDIVKLQNEYFSLVFEGFKKTTLLDAIKKNAIESALEKLTGDEIHGKISSNITDIVKRGVYGNKSYSAILKEVSSYVKGSKEKDGAFKKISKGLVNDSINVFAADYMKAVTDDLGAKWFLYTGSLKTTSRPLCVALVNASNGCMPYIHESQLNDVTQGIICGESVSLNGLYPGTNRSNFQSFRGGYNCGHQLYPVSEFLVPKELRDQFK